MKLALLGAFFTTWSFLKPPSTKQMPSWGALSTEKVSPYLHWKIKHFSRKWFLKNSKYLKYYLLLLSVFHLFMKQHWKIQNGLSPTILLWCTDLCSPPTPTIIHTHTKFWKEPSLHSLHLLETLYCTEYLLYGIFEKCDKIQKNFRREDPFLTHFSPLLRFIP